jgi:SAM-dependent methyltransferase
MNAFSSTHYWEARYRANGTSGSGSAGRLARFKAAVINHFVADNRIASVLDLGCGDGSLLALLDLPDTYIGADAVPAAIATCAARHPEKRFVLLPEVPALPPAELTLSLDVLYHLIEDAVFLSAIQTLFAKATRHVVIYASNADVTWPVAHVRHRRFTDTVAAVAPDWRLLAHLPNPYPFDPRLPNDTSFADFFIYGRPDAPCRIHIPAVDSAAING